MNSEQLLELIASSLREQNVWKNSFGVFESDETLQLEPEKIGAAFAELNERLKENYPFFHPRYAGQMLKPPHPAAIAAYFIAMQINPNNHALDGGPATAKMEIESVAEIAAMFGYEQHLGHLTSSGTIANLEALFVARSLHPGKKIAFSSQSHYTHKRMCELLGVDTVEISTDNSGKIDLNPLENELKKGNIGTVVATIGTTSLGAVDPLDEIIPLCRRYDVRVHADAAYGGFFILLAKQEKPIIKAAPFLHLSECDSIVVDPHKHGLQPYGCGCVLFHDPTVGRFYKHDSPYTYFTSRDLHLGEISLECSRAGAAAAALWTTLKLLPLQPNSGLGTVLEKTRKAGSRFAGFLSKSDRWQNFVEPELDIVTYFPKTAPFSASSISQRTEKIFNAAMIHPTHPLFLALLKIESSYLKTKFNFIADQPTATILRSVLMKPEHLRFVPAMFEELEKLAGES
ncbi:MAG: aspartate aminotransferase family protein [Bacteroidota bacterium]|nr:aspartate aminotransferase family protein [Bacteroidota bacterium]